MLPAVPALTIAPAGAGPPGRPDAAGRQRAFTSRTTPADNTTDTGRPQGREAGIPDAAGRPDHPEACAYQG